MKLNLEQNKKVDEIESIICQYFQVREQDVINNSRIKDHTIARYFLWYILHYNLCLSSLTIARLYLRSARGIKVGLSKVKLRINTHKYYKNIYEDLMAKIEPIMPKNIDKFLNKVD